MPRGRPKKKEDWEIKIEQRQKATKNLINTMTQDQRDALNKTTVCMSHLIDQYRELVHPDYNLIVELDNCFWAMKHAFDTGSNKND